MTKFRTLTNVEDQQQYGLSLISRQISNIETMQNKLTDYSGYVGCKPAAATKLLEARAALETVQSKIIEAITAQATDE